MAKEGISIIVCCYNSAYRLPETLMHLAKQQVADSIDWEVVIVNNKSTDNTTEVALKEWDKHGLNIPLKIVDQPIAGLSNARTKGVEESQYEYIVYCDDDNWLFPEYIQRAHKILHDNKNVAACGGAGIPVFENENKPFWFDKFQSSYAVGPQLTYDGIVPHNSIYGAGFAFKRSLYLKSLTTGTEKLLTGRLENKLTAGDDYEMSVQYKLMGYELYYDSNLKFYHYIPASRLEDNYVRRLFEGFGAASAITIFYDYALAQERVSNYLFYKQVAKAFWRTCVSHIMYFNFEKKIHLSFNKAKLSYLLSNKQLVFRFIKNLNQSKTNQLKDLQPLHDVAKENAGDF